MMEQKREPKLRFGNTELSQVLFDSLVKIKIGLTHTPRYVTCGRPFLSSKNISKGYIDFEDIKYMSEEEFSSLPSGAKPIVGDILFTRVGSNLGNPIILEDEREFGIFVSLGAITVNSGVNNYFIKHWMDTPYFWKQVEQKVAGGAKNNLNTSWLKEFKLAIPTFSEQKKIAEFLSSVDKKISLLKEKHTLLTQYKKGVMQKLFKQEIRFKDENGKAFTDWQEEKLGNHLEEYKEKSKEENQFEVLTSSRTGLMKQSDYYGEGRITERSNKGFNVIPHGYLTYRSRSDDRQFFFNLNDLGFTGIISTYYPVFKMKNNQNKFFVELSRFHKNRFGRQAVGTSQVVLSFNEVRSIKFPMPSTEEQIKISAFLNAIDKKLEAANEQIELTQTFKKGLLQQMFV